MRLKSIKILYETNDAREKKPLSSKLERRSYTICIIIITSTRAEYVTRGPCPLHSINSEIRTLYIRGVFGVGFWGDRLPPKFIFVDKYLRQYPEIESKLD